MVNAKISKKKYMLENLNFSLIVGYNMRKGTLKNFKKISDITSSACSSKSGKY